MKKRLSYFTVLMVTVSVVIFLSLPVFGSDKKEVDAWEQYTQEDGITGYEHHVQRSKYLETKANTVVDAPIEVLLEVLMDIPSYPQWMYECKQTIPLEQKGDLYRVLYFAQGVPFGSPDRDAVIEAVTVNDWKAGTSVTTLQSTDSYPFSLESEANKEANQAAGGTQYVPPKRQRMIEFSGKWDLRMVDRNRTRVIYTAYTNPGGFAPRFVVNGVIRKVSFRSLKGLIRMAREPKYIQAAEKGIVKPDIEKAIAQGELKFAATAQPQAGAQ